MRFFAFSDERFSFLHRGRMVVVAGTVMTVVVMIVVSVVRMTVLRHGDG